MTDVVGEDVEDACDTAEQRRLRELNEEEEEATRAPSPRSSRQPAARNDDARRFSSGHVRCLTEDLSELSGTSSHAIWFG